MINVALGSTGVKRIEQLVHVGFHGVVLKTFWGQVEFFPTKMLPVGTQHPQRYGMFLLPSKVLYHQEIGPPQECGCGCFHDFGSQRALQAAECVLQSLLQSEGGLLDKIPQV